MKMDFLNKLEFWQVLILLFIIIGAVFGLIILLTKLFSKASIKVKLGNNEISAGVAEQKLEETKPTTPTIVEERLPELEGISETVRKKDLIIFERREFSIVINKIKETSKHQTLTLHIEKIEKQMKCAVERTDELIFLLSQNFMFEITRNKKVSSDDPLFQKEYKTYSFFLDNLKEKLKNFYRLAFKENNFENYSVEGFNEYINQKSVLIAKFVTEYFNEYYFPLGLITKEEVLDLHRRTEGKQKETINNIFMNAKRIFHDIRQKLNNIDVELDNFIVPLASRD
jgi:hypothetical protein